jgi:hypothetical protein
MAGVNMKFGILAFLIFSFVVIGCSGKRESKSADHSATDTTGLKKSQAPAEALGVAIRDFARRMAAADTLYVAFGDQDPSTGLLEVNRPAGITLLPASQKPTTSDRTTLTLYPESAVVSDSVILDVKWQAGVQAGRGKAVVQVLPDSMAIRWLWGRP